MNKPLFQEDHVSLVRAFQLLQKLGYADAALVFLRGAVAEMTSPGKVAVFRWHSGQGG